MDEEELSGVLSSVSRVSQQGEERSDCCRGGIRRAGNGVGTVIVLACLPTLSILYCDDEEGRRSPEETVIWYPRNRLICSSLDPWRGRNGGRKISGTSWLTSAEPFSLDGT